MEEKQAAAILSCENEKDVVKQNHLLLPARWNESLGIDQTLGDRILLTSDWHAPNLDFGAFEWFIERLRLLRRSLSSIYLVGDIIDFKAISFYLKHPDSASPSSLRTELTVAERALARVRQVVGKNLPIYYIMGNHETRLYRYLYQNAPPLAGLSQVSIQYLLNLKEHRVVVLPYLAVYLVRGGSSFVITHGQFARKNPGASALAEMQKWGESGASGHTHRASKIAYTYPDGRTLFWVEIGCLCAPDKDYAPTPNWQHAFAILEWNGERYVPHLEYRAAPSNPNYYFQPEGSF